MNPELYVNLRNGQQGATLIEALVGMLLMAIVGLGLSYAASRSLLSQRDLNAQNVVISKTREWLLAQGVSSACAGAGAGLPITIGDATTTVAASCGSAPITIAPASQGQQGTGGDDHRENEPADLRVTLGANSVRTSVTASTPDNATTRAMFGGDGKIGVSL